MGNSDVINKQNKRHAIATLLGNVKHIRDYYVLLIGAILLAIGAIFVDSIPVLIASMIVAPLSYPVLALGLGIAVRDWRLVGRMAVLLGSSCVLSLVIAVVITLLFGSIRVNDVYVSFTENHGVAVVIAFVAGTIATYGLMRPRILAVISGIAIAVSLLPPLVATGVGFAANDIGLATNALTLFLLNVFGILLASLLIFRWFKVRTEYRFAKSLARDRDGLLRLGRLRL